MRRRTRAGESRPKDRAVLLGALLAAALRAGAADPGTAVETAALAKQGAPGLLRAGAAAAEVPRQIGQCLRLPLGIVEMVFSPLPGVEFGAGLQDAGHGLVAPFKLGEAVLELPYEVFGGLGQAVSGVAG